MLSKSLFATVAAVTLFAAPAYAGDADETSVAVRYGDLNLASEDGVAAFTARVTRAAASVCRPADVRRLDQAQAFAACRVKAIADAKPQMQLAINAARKGEAYAQAVTVKTW